jgi:hypothetical protein
MPSISQIMEREGIGPRRPARGLLAALKQPGPTVPSQNRPQPTGGSLTARARAQRAMTYDTAMAIQEAKSGDDSELLPYRPTPSINPPRPRTLAAGYDKDTQVLRVRFRDGVGYEYYDVSPREAAAFKRVKSPGRYINRVLNHHDYAPASW